MHWRLGKEVPLKRMSLMSQWAHQGTACQQRGQSCTHDPADSLMPLRLRLVQKGFNLKEGKVDYEHIERSPEQKLPFPSNKMPHLRHFPAMKRSFNPPCTFLWKLCASLWELWRPLPSSSDPWPLLLRLPLLRTQKLMELIPRFLCQHGCREWQKGLINRTRDKEGWRIKAREWAIAERARVFEGLTEGINDEDDFLWTI